MKDNFSIQYIANDKIDRIKWDTCIQTASNSLIYAFSWWLDNMAVNWDALILNDYEVVMPLTWKRKYGIKYLYQPPFTQQLGIFSKNEIPERLVQSFLQEASKRFKFAEIFLNYSNRASALVECANFILPLHHSYEELSKNYRKGLVKSLKMTGTQYFRYQKTFNLDRALCLHRQHYGEKTPHIKSGQYKKFNRVCITALEQKSLLLRAVCDEKEILMAVALILQTKNRITLIQSVTLPEGRKRKANHYLLDNIIKEFCGQCIILDFEGSEIPGIAHFYKSFGSFSQPYFFYRNNHLPWPVKLIKN